jgi:hypothetical protein
VISLGTSSGRRRAILPGGGATPAAVKLGQAIYQDGAFDRLPILGDALEEAGCTDERILQHCRRRGWHARGCWVVDLVRSVG